MTFNGPTCTQRLWKGPRKGELCEQPAMTTRDSKKCRKHGGKNLRGMEHPSFKHGLYSKEGGAFTEAYTRALNDPQLLDTRESIAILSACLDKAVELAVDLETPDYRQTALRIYARIKEAQGADDPDAFAKALNEIGAHLRRGVEELRAHARAAELADLKGKRVEGAWKTELMKADHVSAIHLAAILGGIRERLKQELPEEWAGAACAIIGGALRNAPERKALA